MGVVAIVLALSGCSYQHAGKAVVGGTVLLLGGAYVFNAGADEEGGKTAGNIALGAVAVGLVLIAIGVLEAAAGPPRPEPPDPRPAPVAGTPELRRQTRVAQQMASHGKCDQVQQIARGVVAVDRVYYERTFLRDTAIARCTAAVMAPPETPPR